MMQVLETLDRSCSCAGPGGSCGGPGSSCRCAAGCSGAFAPLFGGEFREEEVGVAALAATLHAAGLAHVWREATGLPGPPP